MSARRRRNFPRPEVRGGPCTRKLLAATLATILLCGVGLARADGARDWINVPVDMNFGYLYYAYSNSYASLDMALPIDAVSVDVNMPILRYARSMDIAGRAGGIQLVLPYVFVSAELEGTQARTSKRGWGDLQAAFIANVFGAPALSREAFASWQPEAFLTASIWVTAPTGLYVAENLVNIGKNRWTFKPELSYGVPVGKGGLFALNGYVDIFTDNRQASRSRTLSQDPLWSIEGHFSQNLSPALWLSADAYWSYGGETSLNGVAQDNLQSTLRLGVSGSQNLTPVDAVSFAYSRSVVRRDSTPASTLFQINYSRAW